MIELIQGDITKIAAGAIVNAANSSLLILPHANFRHSPYLSIFQPHFNTPRMIRCRSKQILHHSVSKLPRPLVLFKDDSDFQTRVYIFSVSSVHNYSIWSAN